MKYTMKKIIAFLLTMALFVNTMPLYALATDSSEAPPLRYASRGPERNTEAFDVEVSFLDYNDNPIPAPSVTGDYYLIVVETTGFSAETMVNNNGKYWSIQKLGNCAGMDTPFVVSIPGFSNQPYNAFSAEENNKVGDFYNDLSDQVKNNLKVRLVHTTENLDTLGTLINMANSQRDTYNTIMNQSFSGYDPLGTNGPVSNGEVDFRTGFKLGNTKELDVVIEFDPAEDATAIAAGDYYVVLQATSANGYTAYYKTIDLETDGSAKTIIDVDDGWTGGQQYSPNWKNVTAKVIKAKSQESVSAGPNAPNENNYYDVTYIQNNSYKYSYTEETDDTNHILHMEHKFTLTHYPLEDALNPVWILGPGVNYGVTAQIFNQTGHMQTNFATNDYRCSGGTDVNVQPDLGNTTGSVVAAHITGVMHMNPPSDVVLFIDKDDIGKVDHNTNKVIVVESSADKISQSIVNPILNHGTAMSGILAQKEATYTPTSKKFDLTVFEDGKTIYINAANLDLSSGVEIKMHPNQTIVFNVPGDNVKIGQIQYTYSNGMVWSEVKDHIAEHTVFNMPNATNVDLHEAIGMFLIPQAGSTTTITLSSEGWIISNGEVTSGGQDNEWHCRNKSLTLSVDADTNFGKTVNGASPAAKEVFEFELFQWDENESNDTSDAHWTKVATLTNSGPSMTYSVLYNNGNGGRVFKIREKGKASTTKGTYIYDQSEYYITIVYMGASGVVYAAFPEYYTDAEHAVAKFRSNDISGTPESSRFMGIVDATEDENAISAITFHNTRQPENITVNKAWVYAEENSAITEANRITFENGAEWPADTRVVVQLQKQVGDDGEIVDVEGKSAVLSADQPSHTFTGLVQYEGDDEITYSVKEERIEGTYAEHFALDKTEQRNDGSFLITNKEKTAELTLTKSVTVNYGTLADMDIQFVVKDEDGQTVTTVTMKYPSEFTNGSKSVKLTHVDGILPGKTYTIEETATSVQQAGYTRTTTVSCVETPYEDETVSPSGEVEINTETNSGEIAFGNTYTRNTGEETVDDSVTVNKLDGNGDALDGAVFTLYKADGSTKIKDYPAADGTVTFGTTDTDLEGYLPDTDGGSITFKVKETTAPAGYKAISTVWDVVISTKIEEVLKNNKFVTVTTYTMTINGTPDLDVTNEKDTGEETVDDSVTVNKLDGNGAALDGAVFTLYKADGSTKIKDYPATDGTVTFGTTDSALKSYLPGENNGSVTLKLKETTAPAGYKAISTVWDVVISTKIEEVLKNNKFITVTTYTMTIAGKEDLDVTNEKDTGEETVDDSVTVNKLDGNGDALDGAVFTLYKADGSTKIKDYPATDGTVTFGTTDSALTSYLPEENNGTVTLKLKETTAPAGYKAISTVWDVVISTKIEEVLKNNKFITVTTYTMTIAGKEDLDVTNEKDTGEETVDDSVTVNKLDGNGDALDGAVFTLYKADGSTKIKDYPATDGTVTFGTTDSAIISYLPDADGGSVTFKLMETTAPAGYKAISTVWDVVISTKIEEVLKDNKFVTVTTYTMTINGEPDLDVTNEKDIGEETVDDSVTVNKLDGDGAALDGAVFTLYKADGSTKIKDYPAAGGTVTFGTTDTDLESYLPETDGGSITFKLKETTAPEGYKAISTVWDVVISTKIEEVLKNNKFITVTTYTMAINGKPDLDVTNEKDTGEETVDDSVTVNKLDGNGDALDGAVFTLYKADGSTKIKDYPATNGVLTFGTTDTDLEGYLPDTDGGSITFKLKETTAPEGYKAISTVWDVVISTKIEEVLKDNKFVTVTTYTMTIAGKEDLDVTNEKDTGEETVDDSVTVNKLDGNGDALDGAVFTLYEADGTTKIKDYPATNGVLTFGTTDTDLEGYLPDTNGGSITLKLKETTAPAGYKAISTVWDVVISTKIEEVLKNNKFVTVTTYTMTINGAPDLNVTNEKDTGEETVDDSVTVNKLDGNGEALDGAVFTLYKADGSTKIKDYPAIDGTVTFGTTDSALKSYLPGENNGSVTLKLRETTAPAGYKAISTVWDVVISTKIEEVLKNNKFITVTTYTMTIAGKEDLDVTNEKDTGEETVDDSVTVNKLDGNGDALDGAVFTLYEADGTTKIKDYPATDGTVTFGTTDSALASYLPEGNNGSVTLKLKETTAPEGYKAISTVWDVVISTKIEEVLKNNKFVTVTTYTMTIAGKEDLDVTNEKDTGEETVDDSVTVNKLDGNGDALDGAVFTLYEADGTTKIKDYPATDGTVTFGTTDSALASYLPEENNGSVTLKLKETTAPAGYKAISTVWDVVISTKIEEVLKNNKFITVITYTMTIAGKEDLDVTNEKDTGEETVDDSVTVNKLDGNGAALDGAVFTLYKADGSTKIKDYPATDGIMTFGTADTDLGSYLPDTNGGSITLKLKETTAPEGYKAISTVWDVVISTKIEEVLKNNKFITVTTYTMTIAGKEDLDVTNEKDTGEETVDDSVTVNKLDGNGDALDGAVFTLYKADGTTKIKDYPAAGGTMTFGTTDTDLESYLPDTDGSSITLKLKETTAPEGYKAISTVWDVVISTKIEEVLKNNKFITVTTYTMTIAGEEDLDVTNEKDTGEETVDDSVTVNKLDGNGDALDGAVFTLYETNGTTKIKDYTATSGTVTFGTTDDDLVSYLPKTNNGSITLKLKETTAPEGYKVINTMWDVVISTKIEEVLKNNKFITVTTYTMTIDGEPDLNVTNQKDTGDETVDDSVTVNKLDGNGDALDGAVFTLYEADGTTKIKDYSAADGTVTFGTTDSALISYLPDADGGSVAFKLMETTAPAGYKAISTVWDVVISTKIEEVLKDNKFVTVTTYTMTINGEPDLDVTNEKDIGEETVDDSVTVNKLDGDGAALDGAVFTLYKADGTTKIKDYPATDGTVTFGTTDSALTSYLPETDGDSITLKLKETKAPEGYKAISTVWDVVISTKIEEVLKNNKFVTVTTYTMTINGEPDLDVTNEKDTGDETVDDSVTVNKLDGDGDALDGAVFTLYETDGTTKIKDYPATDGTVTFGTTDSALKSYLPGENNGSVTLKLKETTAPEGYKAISTVWDVVISTKIEEVLKNNKFVMVTTYTMTIAGKEDLDVTNEKDTGEETVDDSVTVNKLDGNGDALDGAVFTLYEADGSTKIKDYPATDGTVTFGTTDGDLASYLPKTNNDSIMLKLKETKAPEGYKAISTVWNVVISTRIEEVLKNNKFVTVTTYTMTIAGKENLDVTNEKDTGEETVDDSVTVNKLDGNGAALDGAVFTLYKADGSTKIKDYPATDGTVTFGTTDADLESYLPDTDDGSTALKLKETTAPKGYKAISTVWDVVISTKIEEVLKDNKFVTVTTYTITIDGAADLNVINEKDTGNETVDDSITVNKLDGDGAALDGAVFTLYEADGTTKIKDYPATDGTVTFGTTDSALTSYLPEENNGSVTLKLKETTAPKGYKAISTVWDVEISTKIEEVLKDNKFVTVTTYTMTIDGASDLDVTNEKDQGNKYVHDSVTINKLDENNTALTGATFKLYSDSACETEALVTYSEQSFTIHTDDAALASLLPTENGGSTKLYLKETETHKGYKLDDTVHNVVITTTISEPTLDETENKFITTYTYTILIDGMETEDITNTQKTGEKTVHDKVTVNKQDQDKKPLSGATFTLYKAETCDETDIIKTYSGSSFDIETEDSELADYLPTENDKNITLYLKETIVPENYIGDDTVYEIVIRTTISEPTYDEKEDAFITTTTYEMTIDGETSADVTNILTGDLEIVKTVNSDIEADQEQMFVFTVTLDDDTINGEYGEMTFTDGVAVVEVSAKKSATATGLPTGIHYEVEETTNAAFVITEMNGEYGDVQDGCTMIEFTNTRKTGTATPEIIKKMEGPDAKQAPDGEYVFKLTAVDGAPMPESDEVTVSLKKGELEGNGVFGEITYNTCGTYEYEITEVPGNTPDMTYSTEKVMVTVTVEEGDTELVTTVTYQDNNNTLVNTYESAKVSAIVQKVWNDNENSDGLRPTGLTIELLADGAATGRFANLNAENNWIDRIDKLPKCKDGKDIVYSWKELAVVGYTLTDTATSGTLTTLTNTHDAARTAVEVKKVWVDDGTHPEEVEVQLFADGKALGDAVKLNAGNNWKYSWKGLSRNVCKAGTPREIRYTVAETKIPDGYVAKITGNASTGFVITNTRETGKLVIEKEFDIQVPEDEPEEDELTTDIEIVKIWDDNDNADGNRPESITIHLYAGGEEIKTAQLTAANGWKRKFGELPKFVNGHPITYTVKEDPVPWYVAEIHGFTILNKYQPELTSVSVRKVWNDDNNKLGYRPASVRMTLSNGMSVILDESNGWMASITGLPTMLNGQPAVYTWTEQELIGYNLESMVTEGTVTVVTNKPWTRPDNPTAGKTPKLPGEEIFIEEYDTPLGVEVIINHVGDCFD